MTAMNAFARADGAWLLSDTASYDDAGHVIGIGSKVVASERLSLAIGISGRFAEGAANDVSAWLDAQPDQLQALANLPSLIDLLEEFDREAVSNGGLINNPVPEGFRLTIALWDREDDRAKCAIIASNEAMACGAPPRTIRPLKTVFTPSLPIDPWPGHSFDPARDARALANYQRRETDDRGIHRVGGAFQAVRVHAGGIEHFEVHSWPDAIGSKVAA